MTEPQIMYLPITRGEVEIVIRDILSEPKIVKVKIIDETIPTELPKYAIDGDSCVDLKSSIDCYIEPASSQLVPTNISIEIPKGFELQIRPRSGLALKSKISVLNSPGTVDSSYRGEIKIILFNHSEVSTFRISKGDRISQAALIKVEHMIFEKVDELSDTIRGFGGFGHTGK